MPPMPPLGSGTPRERAGLGQLARFPPNQSHTARPMISSFSPGDSHATSSVNIVTHLRHEHVRSGSTASVLPCPTYVRFTLDSDRIADISGRQLRANKRHCGEQD